jgi:hypothetical protein
MSVWTDQKDRFFLNGTIIVLFLLMTLYIIFIPASCQTSWVILNVGIGYIMLGEPKRREYYGSFFRAFKEKEIWFFAIIMILLVLGGSYAGEWLMALLPPTSRPSLGGGGNPFVSTPLFLLFLVPIVPLFANAETIIFQSYILKAFVKSELIECKKCGRKMIPSNKCDMCGGLTGETGAKIRSNTRLGIAQVMSAIIFGSVHVLLTWNLGAMVIVIGGYFLARLYVSKGALYVAKIHMMYDYILIAGIGLLYLWGIMI